MPRSRALERGGTVAVNAIHLDRDPGVRYDLLWLERGVRSVANFTRRDARDFLALAGEIPIAYRCRVSTRSPMPTSRSDGVKPR